MKTLKNNVILYDSDCPMCKAYTYGFTASGMLPRNGRLEYSESAALDCPFDKDRARNEIALVDTEKQTVTYGIDSLMKILSSSFGFLDSLFKFKPFYGAANCLYKFISYNRRVIIPAKEDKPGSCTPDFNLEYRLAYITGMLIISFLLTGWFMFPMLFGFTRELSFKLCFLSIFGNVLFSGLIVKYYNRDKLVEYLGNLSTVMFLKAVLLSLPCFFAARLTETPEIILTYVFTALLFFVWEHSRRIRILGINPLISLVYAAFTIIFTYALRAINKLL